MKIIRIKTSTIYKLYIMFKPILPFIKPILTTIAVLLLFIGGCQYGKSRVRCPVITTDTVLVYDTTWNTIIDSIPYPIRDTLYLPGDTIPIPVDVDTVAILRDYYSVYRYSWEKQDSNLQFKLKTTVTKNKPIAYDFTYNILRPQTIVTNNIDNSINYSRYLYFGVDVPIKDIKYLELEAIYAFPKGYLGVGWEPELKSITAKGGVTIMKFKDKK